MSTRARPRLRALVVDDEPLARAHLVALLDERDDVHVTGECGDGRSAVERILADAPDLVLLDIQMPELDGLAVVREVGIERMPPVVFVTAYDEHALAAFDAQALDYLLKPINRDRFTRALDRVTQLARTTAAAPSASPLAELLTRFQLEPRHLDHIAVRTDGRVVLVRVDEIDWIEASDDFVRLHVGKAVYLHRETLSHLEQRLPHAGFLRIHRSTVVNVSRIRELQPWFKGDWVVVLADGTRLHSGRSFRGQVRRLLEGST